MQLLPPCCVQAVSRHRHGLSPEFSAHAGVLGAAGSLMEQACNFCMTAGGGSTRNSLLASRSQRKDNGVHRTLRAAWSAGLQSRRTRRVSAWMALHSVTRTCATRDCIRDCSSCQREACPPSSAGRAAHERRSRRMPARGMQHTRTSSAALALKLQISQRNQLLVSHRDAEVRFIVFPKRAAYMSNSGPLHQVDYAIERLVIGQEPLSREVFFAPVAKTASMHRDPDAMA